MGSGGGGGLEVFRTESDKKIHKISGAILLVFAVFVTICFLL